MQRVQATVDPTAVTLPYASKLHHIGMGPVRFGAVVVKVAAMYCRYGDQFTDTDYGPRLERPLTR
jgi:hypothetical protein